MINHCCWKMNWALVMLVVASSAKASIEADDVLGLAEEAGRWVAEDISSDNRLGSSESSPGLATGIAGRVVFLSALYQATGDEHYLRAARKGANILIQTLQDEASFVDDSRRASLYTGVSGMGVALLNLNQVSPDPIYGSAIGEIVARLTAWSARKNGHIHFNERFNDLLYGDAGTALFLAMLGKETDDSEAMRMSRDAAHYLLTEAMSAESGNSWLFRRDKEFNLPNFSHGTAGIAYVLATVGAATDDTALLEGAERGCEYLVSIAEIDNQQLRMPYGWGADNWQGLYEFGWAHGVTGTAIALHRLQQSGVCSEQASQLIRNAQNTLMSINVASEVSAPFAEPSLPLDFRFGRAGVLSLVSYWASQDGSDARMAVTRDALYERIRNAAVREKGTAYWTAELPAFMGEGTAAHSGLLHGASGIGLALLNVHADLTGNERYANMPDDPLRGSGP